MTWRRRMNEMTLIKTTIKDWETDQEVRWCPGSGDYAIRQAVQRTLLQIGAVPAKTVSVPGIDLPHRFHHYIAIGTASSRERMSRYVYVSGVDVTCNNII